MSNLKNKLKRIIPKNALDKRASNIEKRKISNLYEYDKNRFINAISKTSQQNTADNLRSKITFHYHSIEKGLSNSNFRAGFGEKAFKELFNALNLYLKMGYSVDDDRFQQALATINAYIMAHKELDFSVSEVQTRFNKYSQYLKKQNDGVAGFGKIKIEELPNYSQLNFEKLAYNRHSIRDFGKEKINDKSVLNAIKIATKTPSVCNRQAYKVYQIKNEHLLEKIFKLQAGLTTNGENLQQFLLVTCNREYMLDARERNQTYIDGGMFLMTLVYALTYEQIATCTLNSSFSLEKEKLVRELLAISESEDLIAFVALGSYSDEIKYAKSPRDTYDKILTVFE
ncbi:nitroreductase family protein [Aerococcus urinaeequi]|uniref:nitroreductase family protein n=1 Tax=Aerococcus urinaeequi TaxID=51665 RepID=UPI003B3A1C07